MSMEALVKLSNEYGANPEIVLAGGGNTSYKDERFIYVKASGTSLATITPEGFATCYRDRISAMMERSYPQDDAQREAAALKDLLDARLESQRDRRPSVETLLHNLFPFALVLHVHPALVNGLTCGRDGEAIARELFGQRALWVPICKPGYVLSITCHQAMEAFRQQTGCYPQIVLLQNHGLFVAADTREEIDAMMEAVLSLLESRLNRKPDFSAVQQPDAKRLAELQDALQELYAKQMGRAQALFCSNQEVLSFVKSQKDFEPLQEPFTPDHIVYCKARPLYIRDAGELPVRYAEFTAKHGYAPKIVAVENLGFFSLGQNEKEAETAELLFLDAVKIAVYAESFGGYLPMTKDLIDFIVNWEMEAYRQSVSLKK